MQVMCIHFFSVPGIYLVQCMSTSIVNGSLEDGSDGNYKKSPDVKSPIRVWLFLKLKTNSCGNSHGNNHQL